MKILKININQSVINKQFHLFLHYQIGSCKCLFPAKVLPSHLVELHVERPVEIPESVQHFRWYVWMRSAFRFPQASRSTASFWLLEAGEAFSLVKVEVLIGHHPFESQKILHPAHFSCRVGHQLLAAHEKNLREREIPEPVLQVFGVDADPHGAPGRVDQTRGGVLEDQILEGRQAGAFAQSLSVVRHGPGHGVTDHHDELGAAAHGEDAGRCFTGDEVAGCFLHGDLAV